MGSPVQSVLDAIDRVLVALAVAALLLMTVLCVVSVAGRYLFSLPVPDDLTFSEMLLVVLVFLPFGRVQALREHVSVTLLTDLMPARAQALCTLLALLVGLIFFGVVTAATFDDFYDGFVTGAYYSGRLDLPEWPARFAVFLGCAAMFLRLVLDLVASLLSSFRR
jgi:TRAP-type C4-dicarboxylate transport system permease small subunit